MSSIMVESQIGHSERYVRQVTRRRRQHSAWNSEAFAGQTIVSDFVATRTCVAVRWVGQRAVVFSDQPSPMVTQAAAQYHVQPAKKKEKKKLRHLKGVRIKKPGVRSLSIISRRAHTAGDCLTLQAVSLSQPRAVKQPHQSRELGSTI